MNPKISVVIPVYNVEKYLRPCVESVLRQTFQDFEIILVDDGSMDSSGNICDILKDEDARIRVIHKDNRGLSHTRNVGTECARGDYVTYIDSDDTVASNYLQTLLSLIEDYSADVSSCEFSFCRDGEEAKLGDNWEYGSLSGMEALKKMLIGDIHNTSACGLLIKTYIAKKYAFPVGKFHEDDLTTYKYFMAAGKVAYTRAPLYMYYQRQGSIMHKSFGMVDIHELDAGDKIYDDCKKLGSEYEEAAIVKRTNNYMQVLSKVNNIKSVDSFVYKRIKDYFRDNFIRLMTNRYVTKKTKIKIVLINVGALGVTWGI